MAELRAALVVLALAGLLAGGCGDEDDSFRVGVLNECSGLFEAAREPILAATQLPFLARGAQPRGDRPSDGIEGAEIGGRTVEIVEGCVEVTQLTRQILETRRLVEEEGVDVVIGPVGEVEGSLAARLARRYPDTTFVLGASAAQEATLADPRPNVFRFSADGAQGAGGLGAYAYRELGWRTAAVVMDPVPASWEGAAGFVAEFCSLGGTVAERSVLLSGVAPGGAGADRSLGERLARSVDGTMLISGFYSPASFLRGYAADKRPLPRGCSSTGSAS
jgi:branched-chain amino acid transport system substrate-binding protein